MSVRTCQIKDVSVIGSETITIKIKIRIIRILFRIIRVMELGITNALKRLLSDIKEENKNQGQNCSKKFLNSSPQSLKEGDIVKIRSKDEILQTLDENNRLGGCSIMNEMWKYCGSKQKLLKKVNYFYDERKMKFLKTKNIVLLEGLHCSGNLSESMPQCNRYCLFFWREEWLEKIGEEK